MGMEASELNIYQNKKRKTNYDKFNSNDKSIPYNCLESIFIDKNYCNICLKQIFNCFGHTGLLKLEIPFLHCLFNKKIIKIIQTLCLHCNNPHNLKISRFLYYKFLKNYFLLNKQC